MCLIYMPIHQHNQTGLTAPGLVTKITPLEMVEYASVPYRSVWQYCRLQRCNCCEKAECTYDKAVQVAKQA